MVLHLDYGLKSNLGHNVNVNNISLSNNGTNVNAVQSNWYRSKTCNLPL